MTLQTAPEPLAAGQKNQYDTLGYCVVDDLWTENQIQEIEDFFEDFKNLGLSVFDGTTLDEVDITQRQVRAMQPHRHSRQALEWLINPRVGEVLAALLGKPALVAQSMYYFKPPGARGQGMHQDNFYLVARPATCIAAWTAIDDADVDNGCLYVVPGSNRGDIHCPDGGKIHAWREYGDSHIGKFPRGTEPVPVPVRRGQTMFFSGNLIHGSGPNRTKDRSRRTFIGHYADESSETLSRYYHPVLNMQGETVSSVAEYQGGGPCGGDWQGAAH